jgi:hypothetical protein
MIKNERTSIEPVRKLLRAISFASAAEMDVLIAELQCLCELDRTDESILFWAQMGRPNVIGIGLKCTVRLEAHAYASAVIFLGLANPGFRTATQAEVENLFSSAMCLLSWAVPGDLGIWLSELGISLPAEHPLRTHPGQLPDVQKSSLTELQRQFGERLFLFGIAWILLHELAHLKLDHQETAGEPSREEENEADLFAARWMSDAATSSSGDAEINRITVLLGIAVVLLWLTVLNVYVGPSDSETHPEGYERLQRVLDGVVDQGDQQEYGIIWDFVATMLRLHMHSAGYDFNDCDAEQMMHDPRDAANYLIDRISKCDRKR